MDWVNSLILDKNLCKVKTVLRGFSLFKERISGKKGDYSLGGIRSDTQNSPMESSDVMRR